MNYRRTDLMHGVHQFGEVVEPLWARHQALLPAVDSLGQLPDVALSHLFECPLTFESFKRHWEDRQEKKKQHFFPSSVFPHFKQSFLHLG